MVHGVLEDPRLAVGGLLYRGAGVAAGGLGRSIKDEQVAAPDVVCLGVLDEAVLDSPLDLDQVCLARQSDRVARVEGDVRGFQALWNMYKKILISSSCVIVMYNNSELRNPFIQVMNASFFLNSRGR